MAWNFKILFVNLSPLFFQFHRVQFHYAVCVGFDKCAFDPFIEVFFCFFCPVDFCTVSILVSFFSNIHLWRTFVRGLVILPYIIHLKQNSFKRHCWSIRYVHSILITGRVHLSDIPMDGWTVRRTVRRTDGRSDSPSLLYRFEDASTIPSLFILIE